MRRLTLIAAVLSLLAFAGTATGAGGPPQLPRIPSTWSHAEINVTIKKVPHTLILDRGKIMDITTTQLTLRERDGSLVTIALNDQSLITVDGAHGMISDLRRRMTAQTMRIDGGAAVRVRATSF